MIERNHQLDNLFEIKTLEMKVKIKNGKEAEEGEVLDERGRRTVIKTGVGELLFFIQTLINGQQKLSITFYSH